MIKQVNVFSKSPKFFLRFPCNIVFYKKMEEIEVLLTDDPWPILMMLVPGPKVFKPEPVADPYQGES